MRASADTGRQQAAHQGPSGELRAEGRRAQQLERMARERVQRHRSNQQGPMEHVVDDRIDHRRITFEIGAVGTGPLAAVPRGARLTLVVREPTNSQNLMRRGDRGLTLRRDGRSRDLDRRKRLWRRDGFRKRQRGHAARQSDAASNEERTAQVHGEFPRPEYTTGPMRRILAIRQASRTGFSLSGPLAEQAVYWAKTECLTRTATQAILFSVERLRGSPAALCGNFQGNATDRTSKLWCFAFGDAADGFR